MLSLLPLLFIRCSGLEKRDNYSGHIRGDWVTDFVHSDANRPFYTFSFQDSICSYIHPSGAYSPYTVKQDTLVITESAPRGGMAEKQGKYHFRITALDDHALSLYPITPETAELTATSGERADTIHLKKIPEKNDERLVRIGFYSGPCFGVCPSMYLEIDSEGNILFDGLAHTSKQGMHSGKIPESELKQIAKKLQRIELGKLKKEYAARWTDDQACRIKIETGKGMYESSVYGFDKEPVALRMLLHKLMETYKTATLKQDSSIVRKFAFPGFQQSGFPTSPGQ
ncbi:hypothetical protein DN748_05085 [Sinomicrobium soli]|nr:hypothetical protein DN748_05085 [Sinomicrobium sp. N-1-3-6]